MSVQKEADRHQNFVPQLSSVVLGSGPAPLQFSIDLMTPEVLPAVMELLEQTKGVALQSWETPDLMKRAIERNPSLSLIARTTDGALLGVSFAGDTGFRGFFHHVTVREGFRHKGVGSALVDRTLDSFREIGILRIMNIVENDNQGAIEFWQKKGFRISTARGGVTVQMTRDLQSVGIGE